MKGLVIKSPWIDLILEGKKVWEIRGSKTKIRGKIALIQSGTGLVVGTAELVDCKSLSLFDYQMAINEHCIQDCGVAPYSTIHAWVLMNAIRLQTPIPYVHPQGAVIWVNLNQQVDMEIERAS
ncbi:ASCH domain-containing protein [Brevibacillus sp. NPDC058079]|uniref:ASCH domain-containing protein n=1 Tax=Brevibacillus sp. NPDC058079 TaxID=3346330 RepID=UPI0036EF0625